MTDIKVTKIAFITYFFYAFNFFGQMILARLLTPEYFGIIALVLSVIAIIDMFTTLAISLAYIQAKETETLFSSALALSGLFTIIKTILGLIVAFGAYTIYGQQIGVFTAVIVLSKIVVPISSLFIAKLDKTVKFEKSTFFTGLSSSLGVLTAIVLAYYDFGIVSLLFREITPPIILFIFTIIFFKISFKFSYDKNEIINLLKFSYKMLFSRGAELAFYKTPYFVIEKFFGTLTLGLVSQMIYLSLLLNRLLSIFTQKIAFVFYSTNNSNRKKQLEGSSVINKSILVATMPVALVMFFFPEQIIIILYGDQWLDGAGILRYFSIYTIFFPLFNNLKSYMYARERHNLISIVYIAGVVIMAIGLFVIYNYSLDNYFIAILFSVALVTIFKILRYMDKQ